MATLKKERRPSLSGRAPLVDFRLVVELHCDLQDAVVSGPCYRSKGPGSGLCHCNRREVRVVEDIEALSPELQVLLANDLEVPEESEVIALEAWSIDHSAIRIAWPGLSCGYSSKCCSVEVAELGPQVLAAVRVAHLVGLPPAELAPRKQRFAISV